MNSKHWQETTERALLECKRVMDELPDANWIFVAINRDTNEMSMGGEGCPHTIIGGIE